MHFVQNLVRFSAKKEDWKSEVRTQNKEFAILLEKQSIVGLLHDIAPDIASLSQFSSVRFVDNHRH